MSVKSLPISDKSRRKHVREASSDDGVVIPLQLRRSSRLKMANTRSDLEGERAERARGMYKSRAGYIGALTKLQGNIEELMENCGTLEDLKSKRKSYDEVWRKFVSTHEEYIECLELLCYEEELEKARVSYDEQMSRKLTFDNVIESWFKKSKLESKEVSERSLSLTKKSRRSHESKSSYSSSISSSVVKRKEKLALAQLKTKQLLKEQELKRKMTELQYEREFMEAQMEEERAAVSLDVYKQAEVENEFGNVDNMDTVSMELESSVVQGTELCYLYEEPYWSDERANVVVQPIPFECTPVQVCVPSEQSPASGNALRGQKVGPHSAKETERLKAPSVSSNWPQRVQLPLKQQSNSKQVPVQPLRTHPVETSKQVPVQSQWTHPVETSKQVPVQSQWTHPVETSKQVPDQSQLIHPIEHRMPDPVKVTCSDGFLGQRSAQPPLSQPIEHLPQGTIAPRQGSGEEIAQALRQVVSAPKVEYMRFDGNPMKYVSFMHNFETCLEKDNPDNSRRLQLLIQHCYGKAREAIESCVNLPVEEGYYVAKNTLRENFGKPHIIAKAHIKKLENLPPLKQADGQSLLEFARHLDVAERTLTGMGPEYVSDLNHTNTLRELNRKLPLFMRVKWTECAGRIIESGQRPRFVDFLQFLKQRATLVNNEFGEDLNCSPSKDKEKSKGRDGRNRPPHKFTTMAAGARNDRSSQHKGSQGTNGARQGCSVCSNQHGVWRCGKFKGLPYQDKMKIVQENSLCIKCLNGGHYARICPKTNFKCQKEGCNKQHNTLLHPPTSEPDGGGTSQSQLNREGLRLNTIDGSNSETSNQDGVNVTAATGAGERVCLSVVPLKVQVKGSDLPPVETYALLDSGSEVTLCHEHLQKKLGVSGPRLNFTLSGMTGSTRVESQLLDIVVTSMDETVSVELSNVRTVKQMPLSSDCIAKKGDLTRWPHLCDIELQELEVGEVMLVIGLKEKPNLFLPLEYKAGGEDEPVAVRYSLGWTVIGPVGGQKDDPNCSANFTRPIESSIVYDNVPVLRDEHVCPSPIEGGRLNEQPDNDDSGQVLNEQFTDELAGQKDANLLLFSKVECEIRDEELRQQLERLWKTDFEDTEVETKVCASVEDKRALEIMEGSLQQVNGHFQVALPWRHDPPYLPNNKTMAERRALLLKRRLMKDKDLLEKYRTTMNGYIEKGHAEMVPEEELNTRNRLVWFLPHHPVTHPLKLDKVRVVYDCAAKFGQTSLNQQLLQGPDQTNQLVGVLSRFRQNTVGMVADIEAMFHQVLVDPKDCDSLRFLWWPDGDLTKEMKEYRMVKHLFGATSSPSVVNFCLRKTAQLHQEEFDKEVIETVNRDMYVDDMMKSTSTTEKAISLASQLRTLLEKGGFRLTKWYSNDREVMATIPESERAKSVVNLELEKLPTESALGLKWNIEEDKFVWEVMEKMLQRVSQKPVTRRGIVSAVYSFFDPLGFIAPYAMKAKLLLQTLSRKRLGWDDTLEETDKEQWKRWLNDLPKLHQIQVDRCFKPKGFGEVKEVELHLFSDASRQGYAAVAYLRLRDVTNQVHCAFVMGKARLAPIREISIPRLELTAAVISVRLSKVIREELDMTIDRVCYWTDSTSVLKCINNESKRFHTFESNRLTVIRNGSKPSEWRYVNREDNPADDGSKGLKIDTMLKDDRWLKGPKFLWEDESHWPRMIKVPVLEDDDVEVRKEAQIYVSTVQRNVLDDLISYYSCWWKLKCSIAWLLRYKQYLQMKVLLRKNASIASGSSVKSSEMQVMNCGHLTVAELQVAEREIFRRVQHVAFPEVIDVLSATECCEDKRYPKKVLKKAGASIRQLNPQLKEGLLRVGGRLVNAPLGDERKHPVILPYKHHVTDLIIKQCHENLGHMGQESVLSSLRETVWIVKGRSAVRRVLRRCMTCQRQRNAHPGKQFMADLPEVRLVPEKPPFSYVGVDYFGPL